MLPSRPQVGYDDSYQLPGESLRHEKLRHGMSRSPRQLQEREPTKDKESFRSHSSSFEEGTDRRRDSPLVSKRLAEVRPAAVLPLLTGCVISTAQVEAIIYILIMYPTSPRRYATPKLDKLSFISSSGISLCPMAINTEPSWIRECEDGATRSQRSSNCKQLDPLQHLCTLQPRLPPSLKNCQQYVLLGTEEIIGR
jgi:hypothetical protein